MPHNVIADTSQPSHEHRQVPSKVTAEEKHLFTSFEVQHFKTLFWRGCVCVNISPIFLRANKLVLRGNLMPNLHGEMLYSAFWRQSA